MFTRILIKPALSSKVNTSSLIIEVIHAAIPFTNRQGRLSLKDRQPQLAGRFLLSVRAKGRKSLVLALKWPAAINLYIWLPGRWRLQPFQMPFNRIPDKSLVEFDRIGCFRPNNRPLYRHCGRYFNPDYDGQSSEFSRHLPYFFAFLPAILLIIPNY